MVLSKILRAGEGKILRRLKAIADAVSDYEDEVKALSDAELRAKTDEFRARLADGETVDELLVEAFAVAREAAWRTLGQRPVDVPIKGAAALHVARLSDFADLDGPVWLAEDRAGGVRDEQGWMTPPEPGFWGTP